MNLAVPQGHVTKWDWALGEDQKTWVDTLALPITVSMTLGIVLPLSEPHSACSQFHGQSTLPRVAVRGWNWSAM